MDSSYRSCSSTTVSLFFFSSLDRIFSMKDSSPSSRESFPHKFHRALHLKPFSHQLLELQVRVPRRQQIITAVCQTDGSFPFSSLASAFLKVPFNIASRSFSACTREETQAAEKHSPMEMRQNPYCAQTKCRTLQRFSRRLISLYSTKEGKSTCIFTERSCRLTEKLRIPPERSSSGNVWPFNSFLKKLPSVFNVICTPLSF